MALLEVNGLVGNGTGTVVKTDSANMSNLMKDIRKARLQRQVLEDPKLANKLVKVQASPVYNSKGVLIQSLGYNV